MVIAMVGELGSGKTTYVQRKAKELGITESVTSPTFVILKIYKIRKGEFERLVHIDAYRLENDQELEKLGVKELMADPKNLIMIEWADKVRGLIPDNATWMQFTHEKTHTH